eukprot:gene1622-1991_t
MGMVVLTSIVLTHTIVADDAERKTHQDGAQGVNDASVKECYNGKGVSPLRAQFHDTPTGGGTEHTDHTDAHAPFTENWTGGMIGSTRYALEQQKSLNVWMRTQNGNEVDIPWQAVVSARVWRRVQEVQTFYAQLALQQLANGICAEDAAYVASSMQMTAMNTLKEPWMVPLVEAAARACADGDARRKR